MADKQDWDIALTFGEDREVWLKDLLESKTIELKSQPTTRTHVFIEYEYRGRPSGLKVTKADYWALEVHPRTFILIPTDDLRDLARAAFRRFGPSIGGDDDASTGVAIPSDWLVQRKVPR